MCCRSEQSRQQRWLEWPGYDGAGHTPSDLQVTEWPSEHILICSCKRRGPHTHGMLCIWVPFSMCWPNLKLCQQFIPKLKDHILGCLLDREYKGNTYGKFTDAERNTVLIAGEEIFCCKTLRVNYTTYDVRRDSNTIKPITYPDVMVKSPEKGLHAQPWSAAIYAQLPGSPVA
jgi:hypothetical protein